jgi:cytochrome b561
VYLGAALAGNAALQKRIGGYENTKLHGLLMFLAVAVSIFGWYVIYTNKETQKKQHVTTIHAKIGVTVLLGYISLAVVGAVALNPDFGILKTNKTVRLAHKLGGRALTAASWLACVLGFAKMQSDPMYQVAFGLPLLAAGYFILL